MIEKINLTYDREVNGFDELCSLLLCGMICFRLPLNLIFTSWWNYVSNDGTLGYQEKKRKVENAKSIHREKLFNRMF